MKKINLLFASIIALVAFTSCDPQEEVVGKEYPAGAIVWRNDTSIVNHVIIPKGMSLYIEPGVTVTMNDTTIRPEIIVLGNIYCEGTADKPITFTVAEAYRNEAHKFSRYWGGIICGYDSEEALLQHVTIEYCGAQTTEQSASFQNQLFKTETGEGVPAFHFCNTEGHFVIENCTFQNNAEDQIYITGGKSIVTNNKFISNGFDGGEAINYKSGCLADVAYNLVYDANSNGLKLSNSGALDPQAHIYAYNNTLVNCGWRRPKIKGGSIWLEKSIYAELYNNLVSDCRWGVKSDKDIDDRSIITPNYYFASTTTGVSQYQADADAGQLVGANDKRSATAGDLNPLFASFTIQSNVDINAGSTNSGNVPMSYNSSWNFSLGAGSPALTGGKTDFTRHFATTGITINGVEYKSPAPAAYFGAFGAK